MAEREGATTQVTRVVDAPRADVDGGTEATYRCEDIPSGIRPEDSEAGCRSSPQNLAEFLE